MINEKKCQECPKSPLLSSQCRQTQEVIGQLLVENENPETPQYIKDRNTQNIESRIAIMAVKGCAFEPLDWINPSSLELQ